YTALATLQQGARGNSQHELNNALHADPTQAREEYGKLDNVFKSEAFPSSPREPELNGTTSNVSMMHRNGSMVTGHIPQLGAKFVHLGFIVSSRTWRVFDGGDSARVDKRPERRDGAPRSPAAAAVSQARSQSACQVSAHQVLSSLLSLLKEYVILRRFINILGYLTLREEQRLRVFENKVLRKIFGAKRDEVTRESRKDTELAREWCKAWGKRWFPVLSPPALNDVSVARTQSHKTDTEYKSLPYQVNDAGKEGTESRAWKESSSVTRACTFSRRRRCRCRWKDNIKMDLREVGYVGRDWINLAQDRERWRTYVRAAMNLRVL
ncbi:hypothetical protein ANN_19823, partial [Periplaneta americana]